MEHIKHTIERKGTFYYNRRTPKNVCYLYGSSIRIALGPCNTRAKATAERLTFLLDEAFSAGHWLDLRSAIASMEPKSQTLSEITKEYLDLRAIDPKPSNLAVR